ncbi:ATP-binding protein [Deferribacterales bacterium Es71-Z0220]|uniref:ATP-binding protein n=1 Tax=Deferrivibrio essentukiensis TaxID=2880922 RepID=UPI001F604D58|nr:ATP-binding protein [Deferrivibrio essentukiensis]MCB4205449.1 ATP-binding protein [Deferrivibrio essentukiensis]
MIKRNIEPALKNLSKQYPVVTITGPRQSGKTTLCKNSFPDYKYVNLEALDTRNFAISDPRGFLAQYNNHVILDEIQRAPELLSYIQEIVDDKNDPGQFIITGSQQFEVMSNITQTLAGRTAILRLLPFSISEIKGYYDVSSIDKLILSGFYPRIYDRALNPTQALGDYLVTYIERDLRQIINIKDLSLFEKFLRLCAGRIGQILNLNSLASDVGVSHTTIRSWITLLEASYVVFLLPPWFGNVSKRLIKSPKLYFYDVGLASYLLGLENENQVSRDPLKGNLFKNLVLMEILKYKFNKGKRSNLYIYRDSKGNEIDIIYEMGRDVYPIEVKAGATVANEFFKNIRKFFKIYPHTPYGGGLVYGGKEPQVRTDIKVCTVWMIEEMIENIK